MDEVFIGATGRERGKEVKNINTIHYHSREELEKQGRVIYTESKLDKEILSKKSSSKSFKGWLIGKIKESTDMETRIFLQEIYKKYEEFNSKKEVITLEIIEGWKGKDSISIDKRFDNDFVIETHNKDKETNEVTTSKHNIPKENVNNMLTFISYWKVGESHKCYEFAEMLGCTDWKEVWKERMTIYFPLYYYPLKILEKLGIIKYSGRGKITRII